MDTYIRHFETAALLLMLLMVVGTFGYTTLEGWPIIDSLYMTVITISTVGFSETHPLGVPAQIFTIFIVISSLLVVGYLVGALTQILVLGEMEVLLGRKRLERRIQKLKNHVIVCGCGRVGSVICQELSARGIPFLVIESNTEALSRVDIKKIPHIANNAVEEHVLEEAGIKKAKSLVTTLPSDPDNVFITLSARQLNPEIYIVTRASNESSASKMFAAGADKVVSPHQMGARRMIHLLTQPKVTDFLDSVLHQSDLPLEFQEIPIDEDSFYAGKTLGQSDIRKDFDLIIIGITKKTGHLSFNPNVSTIIEPGDTLISLGTIDNLKKFREKAMK